MMNRLKQITYFKNTIGQGKYGKLKKEMLDMLEKQRQKERG